AVGEPRRVNAVLVDVVLRLQRGQRGVNQLQVAVAVLPRFHLPPGIAVAARQPLEVDDDRVGPRGLEADELEVLRVVAVAVKGEDERQLARRRRLGRVDDGETLDAIDHPADGRRGGAARAQQEKDKEEEGPAEAGSNEW